MFNFFKKKKIENKKISLNIAINEDKTVDVKVNWPTPKDAFEAAKITKDLSTLLSYIYTLQLNQHIEKKILEFSKTNRTEDIAIAVNEMVQDNVYKFLDTYFKTKLARVSSEQLIFPSEVFSFDKNSNG